MSVKRDLSENMRGKHQISRHQNLNDKQNPRERIKSIDSANIDGPFAAYLNDLPTTRNQSPKNQSSLLSRTQLQKTPIQTKQQQQQGTNQSSSSKTVRKEELLSDSKKRFSLDLCQTERETLHKRIQELSEKQIKIERVETSLGAANSNAKKAETEKAGESSSLVVLNGNNQISSACSSNQPTAKKESSAFSSVKQEPSKFSQKRNGIISAYAANTNQGLVRKYNEDRVSIILNIVRPSYKNIENWPRCAFFGIYDGHGGAFCADFLRDNLHQYVISDENFPENPRQALINGFAKAEKEFIERAEQYNPFDKSGSCANVVLLVGEICYIANVGDSRAILSINKGERTLDLSRDHKPCDLQERERIIEAGGRVYQSQQTSKPDSDGVTKTIYGPFRTLPGRLSVSRTFGDIEAKLQKYGGRQGVVIPDPEIKVFRVQKSHDYIFMGSDGIYDKMTSSEVIKASWESIKNEQTQEKDEVATPMNTHSLCAKGVEGVIQEALKRRSTDNLTGLVISFIDFQNQTAAPNNNPSCEKASHQHSEKLLKHSETPLIQKKQDRSLVEQIQLQKTECVAPSHTYQTPVISNASNTVSKNIGNNKSFNEGSNFRRQSPIQAIQTNDRLLISESNQNNSQNLTNVNSSLQRVREKHESITPSSASNSLQQQRRLSLQFSFNNKADTTLLKQQIKAFNTKTIYDASPNNALQSFHSPILAKKDIPSISQFSATNEDENSKLSQMDSDRNDQSKSILSERQKLNISRKVNCIEKKVNELNSEKYLKALFKESTYSNRRVESAIPSAGQNQNSSQNGVSSSNTHSNNASAPSYQQLAQPKIQPEIFNQYSGIYSKSKINHHHLDIPTRLHKVF